MATTGKLISIEGLDGSGKSTVIATLKQLIAHGDSLVEFLGDPHFAREPGGTRFGESIREVARGGEVLPTTQMLLFYAGRVELFGTITKPALLAGQHVIYDRYIDSTYAYQGYTTSDRSKIKGLRKILLPNGAPDLTIFLDISVEKSAERLAQSAAASGAPPDRFDKMTMHQREAIQYNYDEAVVQESARFCIVDAHQARDLVFRDVLLAMHACVMNQRWPLWKYKGPNPIEARMNLSKPL